VGVIAPAGRLAHASGHRAVRIVMSFRITMFAMLACSAAGAVAAPTPEALIREIAAQGPRVVLARLWNDQPQFESVCKRIESGDRRWLEVAGLLKPASDAASSLSLNYSVARAIPRAPGHVLALIGNGFTVSDVCTSPYIEPEPGVAENYQSRAAAALAKVTDSKLAGVKSACLAGIGAPLAQR